MTQLLFEQLEFANLVVLNKTDQITAEECGRIHAMLSKFNPKADILETSFGKVDPELLFGVARFDMDSAAAHPQWLKEARIGEHKPESEEYVFLCLRIALRTRILATCQNKPMSGYFTREDRVAPCFCMAPQYEECHHLD